VVKRFRWLLVAVAATGLLAVAAFEGSPNLSDGQRVQSLSERFACPVCDGQSVSESNAAVATTIREFIAVEVNNGSSNTEIRDALVQAYGTSVLLAPPSDGAAILVWILPLAVLVFGSVAIAESERRGRIKTATPTAADVALVSEALAAQERSAGQ
jgi:cytochrome c-type biogenesis protein CcmH